MSDARYPNYATWILKHLDSPRQIEPKGYIDYLRTQPRFSDGLLDRLPQDAIILHDSRIEEHLAILGVDQTRLRPLTTGTTDPNFLFIVYADDGRPELLLNAGLPGGGGISTQAAELGALGVRRMVHVGTCGLMGPDVPPDHVIVSTGAYKDGAALLLSGTVDGEVQPIARPHVGFSDAIAAALTKAGTKPFRICGYTIPTFYFQPESLIRALVENRDLPGPEAVGYVEMEEAAFFMVAERMGFEAASVVLGSDRYLIEEGKLTHHFEEFDQDRAERSVLEVVRAIFRAGPTTKSPESSPGQQER